MTDTPQQYPPAEYESLNIPPDPVYLLLIDSRVAHYQDIINSKQPGVHHIVFHAAEARTSSKGLFDTIQGKIAELGVPSFTSIGLVQHNESKTKYEMFGKVFGRMKPVVQRVAEMDPYLETWNHVALFITMLRINYRIRYFDMMACALYSNPDWKYIIDELTKRTGVTMRASTDDTGATALGGDWFLESHTGVNLKDVYFTEAIENYNGILVEPTGATGGSGSGTDWSITAKKLILIDSRIEDIHVIIDSMNADTYCLVFNYFHDTPATILSKLRFLTGENRYILDHFHYEPEENMDDLLSLAVLHSEYSNGTAAASGGTVWPFYTESSKITIQKPVFFQRSKTIDDGNVVAYSSSSGDIDPRLSYKPRSFVRVSDLDAIYELALTAGEIDAVSAVFESVGIIQHAVSPSLGYKLVDTYGNAAAAAAEIPAIVQDVQTRDPNLSTWSSFKGFIQALKTTYQVSTVDMMACALYANLDWKYIIDTLAAQENITVRASNDNTGAAFDGGNWVLETNNIELTDVYFTDKIYEWRYILNTTAKPFVLQFDGVNDGVDVGIPAWSYSTQFRTSMTVECWFKTTDTSNQKGSSTFVARYNSGGSASTAQFLLSMNSAGTVGFANINTSGSWLQSYSSLSYNDTLWHHAAGTYNSSTGISSLYIDGLLVHTVTNASYGLLSNNTTLRLTIGCDDSGIPPNNQTDRQFRGSLSDIRVWNVVRSDSEISANYNQRLIGTETGLVGYWELNQGYGTGWGSYSVALDSTSTRANGSLVAALFGATPSGSWVLSSGNISFQPRISTLTLGANNGVYNLSESSFSFIDPSSNSLGDYTYAISSGAVATLSSGSATTKTVYATSGAISIPTLLVYDFPEIASLSSWQIDISFTVTGGVWTWRALVGDMYNEINSRGWGIWVSNNNRIHWSWIGGTSEPDSISVSLNTAYILTAAQSSGTITLTLRTVSSGATQTGSFSVGSNVTGKGPVTIGGWRSYVGENFSGTISYVNVSVPTNQRVVTLSSITGGTPATVTATQAGFAGFSSGTKTASLTVNPNTPTFSTSFENVTKNYLDSSFALVSPVSNSPGVFSFTSSNTSVATINSATTINALQFNGTTNFIDFGSNITELGKASFTIEFWIKTNGTAMGVLNCQDSDTAWESGEKSLYIDENGTPAFVGYSNEWILSSVAVNDNNWHHIAVTWAYTSGISGTGTFYIDGFNKTGTYNSPFNPYEAEVNNTGTFNFGKPNYTTWPYPITKFFNGAVCELRIWNIARSATDIFQNYRRMLVGNESGLVAYNRFNQGTASGTNTGVTTVTNNKTSGGYTGTLSGSFVLTGTASNWISGVSIRPINDVNIIGGGITTITATQDAAGGYISQSTTATLTVTSSAPTFGTFTVPAKTFGDASFNLTAPTSNSDGAFSYTSSNTAVATVTLAGGVVTIVGAGSTTITATQASTTNYIAGSVSASLVVSAIAPTIGALSAPAKNFGDASFNLTAPTSNSDGAFSYTSSNTAVATVTLAGGVVTIVGAGSTTITATQAATTNYIAGSVSASLVVSPIAPTIGALSAPAKNFGDASFSLTAPTSNSGGAFSYTSSNTSVATVTLAGGVVTIVGVGSTTITATQAATTNYITGSVSASLVVSKSTPVITLSAITKTYGDASFNLAPSSTNTDVGGGLISFTSSNADIVTIFDTSYVGIVGVGSAIITMTQTATTNFNSGSGTVMVTISKGSPVLSAFTVSSNRTYGSAPFAALAYPTSVSNGEITYSSSDTNVATIDNSGVITLLASGFVNFIATQASTIYYNSTTKTTNTMTVHRQALQLTRLDPSSSVINKTYGDSYFTVSATNASNGGAITYETDNQSVAGIIGINTAGVISVVSVGTATITARREQTAQYTSYPIAWTVEVARATTTLSGLVDLSYNVTTAPFTLTASSISNGAVTYALQDPSSGVLTIHPTTGLVTLLSPGSAVIVASQAQGTLYLASASITATITVSSAGNALQGATLTNTSSFANVDLSGASLAGVSISTNTLFTDAKLSNANMTNAVITSANFTSANLSGATLAGATITGATFTTTSLQNADLSGSTLTSTVFTGSDLSGAKLNGVDASGSSFATAKLNNADMTGAKVENVDFTNTSIKGAIISGVSFSPLQKLQLLKNSDNRDIGQIIIPAVSGTTILAAISITSPLRSIANLDLTSASVSVSVVVPTTSTSPTAVLPNVVLNVTDNDKFYLPINEGEYFQIDGVKYSTSGGIVRNYATNAVVNVITYNGKSIWLLAGSIVGLVLLTNTLNTSEFMVPSHIIFTETTPFMPTILPTTNSTSPIVYSSNNPDVATIDSSSGLITITGNTGFVKFTATQIQNSTHEPGIKTSNYLLVGTNVNFSLIGLNQTFNLSTLATLDASAVNMAATDATAVFYVRVSDFNNIFRYQTDSFDINNINSSDIKYYVFHRKWPAELKINPSHAMMNKTESVNMLGGGVDYTSSKSLLKHDFIRYIALRLFNTIHGVDLFRNESDIHENVVYLGETVQHNIHEILSGISTTSTSGTMSYDASGNKYLTNDSSGNTNLSRELMRQVAAGAPSRFYNNGGNDAGAGSRNVPFLENDTITFKLIIQTAAGQNAVTGVGVIPSRSYTVKLVLKNTVTTSTNANTVIVDSEMYPNSYPYSSLVTTYPATSESSAVYNMYSPPAAIPFSRFGFNGWYYTNSTTWVNVAPTVRNHIKWLVAANTGSSTVADLQYVRLNLKIHNNASLPYLMIYTQTGAMRKYAVSGGNGSLTNGTIYSIYMNFNSYSREPAMIGYTNAALIYTTGSGTFANNEVITSIALETESNAAAGNVEFTLAGIIVGELSTTSGVPTEKEYGFEAAVPEAYP